MIGCLRVRQGGGMLSADKHLYDFGPFRLDLGERVLLRQGNYVPLPPKTLETLVVLIEHSGRIVEKGELIRQIWPDSFVEDVTLAKNVSMLRKVLGDSEEHRYIDTIPKRGYRFVADVRISAPSAIREIPVPPAGLDAEVALLPPAPGSRNSRWYSAVIAVAVISVLGLLLILDRTRPGVDNFSGRPVPLTSFPGRQQQVAFSPDGKQIALVWDGPHGGPSHIYAKVIGSEAAIQLTQGSGLDSRPAWFPDGTKIAFLRSTPEGRAWYWTSALGGPERKITDIFPYFDLGSANSAYISPDGKSLAIVDKAKPAEPSSIFLLSLDSGARKPVTFPPAGSTGDYYPAFSPDGKRLAFVRAVSFSGTDLYVMTLPDGTPKRLTFDGLTIDGLAWTSNSREIVFSSRRGSSVNSLWRISVSGGTPERATAFGEDVISPAISRSGDRLAYTRLLDDMNIWSLMFDGAGRIVSKEPMIASTFRDSDPDYSPDGSRIAFLSGRNGSFGIWVSDSNGANPRLLFDGGAYVTGSPRWSPDGRHIAFDSRAGDPARAGNPSIWIVDAAGGDAHRLTAGTGDVAPSWSRDGDWIYFGSTRGGTLQIWKIPSRGGPAIQLTRHGGFEGFEWDDGRYLLYVRGREVPGIFKVPVNGGDEVMVTDLDQAGFYRSWRPVRGRIYFLTTTPPAGPRLEVLDLASGKLRRLTDLSKAPDPTIPGLAVSADGRHLLLAQYDQSGSNIIMVERPR